VSAFILRRLLLAIPTLVGVLIIAFLLLYVAPGDPVMAMVGERADEETIARLRTELRLDDPLPVQFGHYVAGIDSPRRCSSRAPRCSSRRSAG
jgi:ABC-type dipeptide/oligopeptide/nickel transport system permease component